MMNFSIFGIPVIESRFCCKHKSVIYARGLSDKRRPNCVKPLYKKHVKTKEIPVAHMVSGSLIAHPDFIKRIRKG